MAEQTRPNVITLDADEVKYSYAVPSMSRRGGVRLHPIKDGVLRHPHERTVTHRDFMGNKLRDVIDPRTGFCMYAVSPVLGGRINKGTSGSATVEAARGNVTKHNGHYFDAEGRHLRTTDMGDDEKLPYVAAPPRPTKPDTDTRAQKGGRGGNRRAANGAKPDAVMVPGGTGANGEITRADVEAYLKVLAKGRHYEINKKTLAMGRAALKAKREQAARKMTKKAGGK